MVVAQEGSLLSVLSSVATTALKNQLSTEDNHNENTVFDPNSKAGEKQAGVFGMTRRCNFLKFLAGGTRTQLLPCPSPRDEELVVIKTTEQELSEAERMISMEIYNLSKVPDHFLLWTLTTSFFHIIQALLMFLIAIAASDSDNRWYWYVSYPNPAQNGNEMDPLHPELKQIAAFSILLLVPLMPLITGIIQLGSIAFREAYIYYVERHQNPFRWAEFSFTVPLMKLLVGKLVGITDVHLLICIVVLMVMAIHRPPRMK